MAHDDAEFCHICGSREELSFEHIPPERCYNSAPTALINLYALTLANRYNLSDPPSRTYRRGLGRRSLCVRCNGFTGDHYGAAFFNWTCQALRYADRVGHDNRVALTFDIMPLRVLKQLATMALAASNPSSARFHRHLRRFVLRPDERHAPPELAFHAYLNPRDPQGRGYTTAGHRPMPLTRMTGVCAVMDVTGRPGMVLFAEIAFPPMGYIIRFRDRSGGPVADEVRDMPDISYFGEYGYRDMGSVALKLPVRSPVGPSPGYYLD